MFAGPREQVVLVIPLVLMALADPTHARPRRRFCENYPFAPRCLGVAAKRSPHLEEAKETPLDLYTSLIRRVYDEMNPNPLAPAPGDMTQAYDDNSLLDTIASLVGTPTNQHYKTGAYMDSPTRWGDSFDDRQ